MNSNPRKGWYIMDNEKDVEVKEEVSLATETTPGEQQETNPECKQVLQPSAPVKKEKKKKGKAGRVVALAIGCTLTGIAIGVCGTLAFMGMHGPGRMWGRNFRQAGIVRYAGPDSGKDFGKGGINGNSGNRQRTDDNGRWDNRNNKDNSGNRDQGRQGNGDFRRGNRKNANSNNGNQPSNEQNPSGTTDGTKA